MLQQSFLLQQRNSIATEKTLSQPSFLLQHRKLCHGRKKNCVATETLEKIQKRPKTAILECFSNPFYPRTINTHFFRFLGQQRRWENTSYGVSLYKLPIFLSFAADFDF